MDRKEKPACPHTRKSSPEGRVALDAVDREVAEARRQFNVGASILVLCSVASILLLVFVLAARFVFPLFQSPGTP